MIELIWNNWLLTGLIPPLLYAVVALYDACLVNSAVYRNPAEATVISAIFGAIPLLLPATGLVAFTLPSVDVFAVAFSSGVLFALHIYFYMAGLFRRNDTVIAETIQNLSVLLVPFFAFFLIGEVVSLMHYAGIGLAAIGVLLMYAYNRKKRQVQFGSFTRDGGGFLVVSMLLFCLILISGEWVYQRTDFWSGYLVFTAGLLFAGLLFKLSRNNGRIVHLMKTRWRLFLLIEGITTAGMICSHRAVDISPSATYVAITECLGAYFILLLSGIIYLLRHWFNQRLDVLLRVCKEQLDGYAAKIIAGLFISSSIYLIYSH